jgi:ribosome recycling factor
LANISVPEPQQIMIRPFDQSALSAIAKAIQTSDLGLSPNSDGRVIRLNIPPLSGERRKQLSSRVKELAEQSRISIRSVRRDANKHADQGEKDKLFSEDDCSRLKDEIQELTKKYEGKVNSMAEAKENEVMTE